MQFTPLFERTSIDQFQWTYRSLLRQLDSDYETMLPRALELIDDLPFVVEELWGAIDRNDSDSVVLMSYTIKGLASNFKVQSLMDLAATLESEYSNLSDFEKHCLAEQITIECEQTILALKQLLGICESRLSTVLSSKV